MAKRILTSIRFDEEKIELIKNREGIESVQGCVDFMIERYYSAYGIKDNFFLNAGVPENRVTDSRIPVDSKESNKKSGSDELKETMEEVYEELRTDGIVTKLIKGKLVKGMLDDKGLFKRV